MSKPDTAKRGHGPASAPEPVATMRLRAEPPRVTRLSRRVLVGIGLIAGVSAGIALIYALQSGDSTPSQEELFTTDRRQTAEGLQGLPNDYGDIPQLGPPLPGDLGGPIVRARDAGRPLPAEIIPMPQTDPAEERRLAEMEAARTSEIFFQTQSSANSGLPNIQLAASGNAPALADAQERQTAFLNAATDRRTVAPDRVIVPASPFILQAGSVIPAALITGIRSDLPGQITAQVTQPVYDSPTGNSLLIPQGTRLIGQYDNSVDFGQRRILLVWNRLILPNGRSIVLERQPGADPAGYAGLEDGVDYHWADLVMAAGLSTLLAVGAGRTENDEDRLIAALRSGSEDTINQAGEQLLQQHVQRAPTLTIRPGFPVRVIVTRDLVLEPYGADQ